MAKKNKQNAVEESVLKETVTEETAAEAAVAEDETSKENKPEKNSNIGYFLRIAGVLTLICSVIALLLSVVNTITFDRIAENTETEKKNAIAGIFSDMTDAVPYTLGDGTSVYLALQDDVLYGYCVSVAPEGYGGPIEMMVGIEYSGAVRGVKIVSMSETAGLGSKTRNEAFLAQYQSAAAPFAVKDNIDAVAGATISSNAVTSGVNAACQMPVNLNIIAEELGYKVPGQSDETETEISASTQAATGSYNSPIATNNITYDTNISKDAVGINPQVQNYHGQDNSISANETQGLYVEKETTEAVTDTAATDPT